MDASSSQFSAPKPPCGRSKRRCYNRCTCPRKSGRPPAQRRQGCDPRPSGCRSALPTPSRLGCADCTCRASASGLLPGDGRRAVRGLAILDRRPSLMTRACSPSSRPASWAGQREAVPSDDGLLRSRPLLLEHDQRLRLTLCENVAIAFGDVADEADGADGPSAAAAGCACEEPMR
jgi:hypothetical protein